MKKVITIICFCSIMITAYSQIDKNSTIRELYSKAVELVQENKMDSAIMVMEYAYDNFPEEYQQSSSLLAQVYTRAGKYSQAIDVWKSGMKKGYNYHLIMPGFTKYYADNKKFKKLKNKEIALLEKSHIKHEVILPVNYNSSNQYPVLFIFHGNNRNIELSKESWTSQVTKDNYISVFLQSYIHSNNSRFVWILKDEKTEEEFKNIYHETLKNYSVDTSKIIFSGMSAGGEIVLDYALNEIVPISGVILNCPVIPIEVSDEQIKQFVSQDKKIGILTGENDFALENQKNLVRRIKEQGGESKIRIKNDIGHEFADDFSSQLDKYLAWVIDPVDNRPDITFFDTKDAYFGQTPPGLVPEVFAPGIVSDSTWAEHCQVAVSPDGKEIYWSAWSSKYPAEDGTGNTEQIFCSQFKNGKWTNPGIAEFIKDNKYGLNGGPAFSPDGQKLFFYQVKSPWASSPMKTYYVEKNNGNWSGEPIDAGEAYNSEGQNYSPMFTKLGSAYKNSGKTFKYTYGNENFTFTDTVIIHKDFRPVWNIYVSPKENYIIFSANHPSGFGDFDLYISFKAQDEKWGTPINMGAEINTALRERFPMVSPDGKYLFFVRHTPGQDFFWVSTDVIEDLRKL